MYNRPIEVEICAQTNLPTPKTTSKPRPWLQSENEYSRRPQRSSAPHVQGTPSPHGVSPVPAFGVRSPVAKREGLKKPQDFATVRRRGRSWSNRTLVLVALPNELGVSRFGFTVGRRVGNAVARNKVKRRLREAARQSDVADGWDLVVLARRDAASAGYRQLSLDMADLLWRARLFERVERPATAQSASR